MHAIGCQIEGELLDRDRPVAYGIVRAKDGSQGPRTNLMNDTKWSKRLRWRRARSFGGQ
jgi:hypothetical protein